MQAVGAQGLDSIRLRAATELTGSARADDTPAADRAQALTLMKTGGPGVAKAADAAGAAAAAASSAGANADAAGATAGEAREEAAPMPLIRW